MLMDNLGIKVSKYPKIAIFLVILITIGAMGSIGYFGIDQEFSEESFMPDMEMVIASNEISEKFTTTSRVSILVKSKNNDVLTSDCLVEMLQMGEKILNDEIINSTFDNTNDPSSNINSVADIISQMVLIQRGMNVTVENKISAIQDMSDNEIKQFLGGLLSSDESLNVLISRMLTKDFDSSKSDLKAKGTMIIVSLNASMVSGDSNAMGGAGVSDSEKKMDEIVKGSDLKSTDMTVMGMSIISDEIMDANTESMAILLPLAFGLVVVILAIIYRNIFDMLISLLALGFAIIWVYGFGSAMGYTFNPMTTAVPILIVGLGIDYGIHITMRYREEIKTGKKIDQSIILTIASVGMALLLATVTTVVSFLSNLASPISLLAEFGVLAAIGIIGSFITMTTFVPACKQIRDSRRLKKGKFNNSKIKNNKSGKLKNVGVSVLDKAMGSGAAVAERHPIPVIVVVLLITVGAVGMATQLETTFNFNDFLPDELEITQDLNYMMEEFELSGGEGEEVDILVIGDISNPELLRDLDETINNMKDDEFVVQNAGIPSVISILSVMYDWATDISMYNPYDTYDPNFETLYFNTMTAEGIPKDDASKEDIAVLYEYLLANPQTEKAVKNVLYKTYNGNFDSTVLRIYVDIDSEDNEQVGTLQDNLEVYKEPLYNSADKAVVTGGAILMKVIMDSLNESQIRSLFITIILSFIVLTIVFWYKWRSMILGLITITPVVFCVAWTLGTMYLVNIPLNMMTITIASLTIGLGTTYGIHITHRFLEDLKQQNRNNYIIHLRVRCPDCRHTVSCSGKPGEVIKVVCPKCGSKGKVTFHRPNKKSTDIDDACYSTVTHTGTALFGAASTTIAGFGLLVFALMPPLKQFGAITALTILFSFLASVFVLPTFLVMWAKWKQKHKKE